MNLRVDAETIRRQLYVFGPAWLVMMADIDVARLASRPMKGVILGSETKM